MKLKDTFADLIEIFNNLGNYPSFSLPEDSKWYFSSKGEKTYLKAETVIEKIHFFYGYLCSIAKDAKENTTPPRENFVFLYKIASIMAYSIDGCSFEFGSYPQILDVDKNPIVSFVKNAPKDGWGNFALLKKPDDIIGQLLNAVHSNFSVKEFLSKEEICTKIGKYKVIKVGQEGKALDVYRIERCIIWAFTKDKDLGIYETKSKVDSLKTSSETFYEKNKFKHI